MKFGTELKVLGFYTAVLYDSPKVPIRKLLNYTVFDYLSVFFFCDIADRNSTEFCGGSFCDKNPREEFKNTEFLKEFLKKKLCYLKNFRTL
jgi:hypothetical protein